MSERTGRELLTQVRDLLVVTQGAAAINALDGCVLLTAAEAEKVLLALALRASATAEREALALLSPAGKDET